MGERIVRNDEVAGSIPVISTKIVKSAEKIGVFSFRYTKWYTSLRFKYLIFLSIAISTTLKVVKEK